MKTLQNLFIDELSDMYDSENRLAKALPEMARAATHAELSQAFEAHKRQTDGHVKKVEQIFSAFGEKPKARKCAATVGIIKEGDELAHENKGEPTINAALISAGQKAEHYEIASYGTLVEWAKLLGNNEAARMLGDILNEEKEADQKLTQLARQLCNGAASGRAELQREGARHTAN